MAYSVSVEGKDAFSRLVSYSECDSNNLKTLRGFKYECVSLIFFLFILELVRQKGDSESNLLSSCRPFKVINYLQVLRKTCIPGLSSRLTVVSWVACGVDSFLLIPGPPWTDTRKGGR